MNGRLLFADSLAQGWALYLIVDMGVLEQQNYSAGEFLRSIIKETRPLCVQLRAKSLSDAEILRLLPELGAELAPLKIPLFCNDHPHLANLAGASGCHLGQEDRPISQIREEFPELSIGLSTHDAGQLESALDSTPDYVAFGPLRGTQTKLDAESPVGWGALHSAVERCKSRKTALVTIGGLNFQDLPELKEIGVYPAMISAMVAPTLSGVQKLAREFELIRRG